MVRVLLAQEADTPAGKLVAVPMPVAPVVVKTILPPVAALNAVLIHRVRVLPLAFAAAVLFAVTVIVPVAFTVPQPPVRGML